MMKKITRHTIIAALIAAALPAICTISDHDPKDAPMWSVMALIALLPVALWEVCRAEKFEEARLARVRAKQRQDYDKAILDSARTGRSRKDGSW